MTVRPAFINTGGTGDIGGRRREFNLYQMVYSGAGRRAAKIQDWTWDNNRGRQNAEYAYSWSASMHPGGTGLYQIRKPAFVRNLDYLNGQCALTWDDAGNLGQVSMGRPGEMFEKGRFLFWTEDNRMHTAVDDKHYSYYAYDYGGERRLKLVGVNSSVDVNAEYMTAVSTLNEPTLYPSAYMVLTNKGYTKHYYAGTERVAARIGGGCLKTLEKSPKLQDAADLLFKQSLEQVNSRVLHENDLDCIMNNEFAKEEFGYWIEGIPYQMKADVECDHRLFKEMAYLMADDPVNVAENDVYFYHSDHLGSASWITDSAGIAVQHLQYLPYGEPYIDQRAAGTTYSERFRFTGKERDEETGFGYFGARYMDHELMTMWLSVDPLADNYSSLSPYSYCAWNPIKLVDPDGCEIGDYYTRDGKWVGRDKYNDNMVYVCDGKDENGNYLNPRNLGVTHDVFCTIANIVNQESLNNEEDLWIAHTANNMAKKKDMSLYKLLMSGYSAVKKKNKTPLASSNKSSNANSARAAVINVLTGGKDPTGGAVLWDGTDFLAWGINHPKFSQYKSIIISANIYNTYFRNSIAKYLSGITYRIDNERKTYQLPADVFIDPQNWNGNTFKYETEVKTTKSIEATGVVGLSIFWKINK